MALACEMRIVTKTFFSIVVLTLITGVLAHAQSPQPVPLQDQYLQIYVKMKDAEQLEKDGDLQTSYEGYLDCQKRLINLKKNDPQGSADLFMVHPNLSDRVADRLAAVKKKLAESTPSSSKT